GAGVPAGEAVTDGLDGAQPPSDPLTAGKLGPQQLGGAGQAAQALVVQGLDLGDRCGRGELLDAQQAAEEVGAVRGEVVGDADEVVLDGDQARGVATHSSVGGVAADGDGQGTVADVLEEVDGLGDADAGDADRQQLVTGGVRAVRADLGPPVGLAAGRGQPVGEVVGEPGTPARAHGGTAHPGELRPRAQDRRGGGGEGLTAAEGGEQVGVGEAVVVAEEGPE